MPFSKLFILGLYFFAFQMSTPSYQAEIEKWRHEREVGLKADGGWLTVAGLFWLKEGENTVGAGPSNAIVLPKGSAAASVGVFEFHDGQTQFQAAPGVHILVNGNPATLATLKSDTSDAPDMIQAGDLTMFVIQRGKRFGIRLRDKNSAMRKAFTGLKFFPPDQRYRVVAKFTPYHPPKKIPIPNILGDTEEEASPGYVEFTLNGHACRLDPVTEGDTLFFIFKDLTSGKETYPSGRFLNTPMPENGEVTLDFNKAYNPPCAFTPYATCPLPPKQNQLAIRIEAGERRYGH
ncbi:MAG TPA: DUF1684 domain-containing protein [Terriglobia bacterium]|nr:DUF1684 domain-containing protein [Terriglobia bacterium]